MTKDGWRTRLVGDGNLPPTVRMTGVAASLFGGESLPNPIELASRCHLSERTVRRHMKILVHAGYVRDF